MDKTVFLHAFAATARLSEQEGWDEARSGLGYTLDDD